MTADVTGQLLGPTFQTGQVVMGRTRVLAANATLAANHHHRAHIGPTLRQPVRVLQHRHITLLMATMTVFHRGYHPTIREPILTRLLEYVPYRVVEGGLIPFDRYHV